MKKKQTNKQIDNKTVDLCVEEERNLWFILLNEICSAILLSEEAKDLSIVQYAAKNVIFINALILR
jgi:hypothetical protein